MNKILLDVKAFCSTNNQKRAYNNLVKELGEKDLCFLIPKTNGTKDTKIKISLLKELQDYKNLKKNWDGYNALPISKKVISNTISIIELLSSKVLKEWVIFPNTNGTILFTIKKKKLHSSFNIGIQDYSFYATIGDKDIEGVEIFDVLTFVENITNITNKLINGNRHSK